MALANIVEVDGRRYLETINPGNGEQIVNPLTGGKGDLILVNNGTEVYDTVKRARKAYEFWRTLSKKERAYYFKCLQREIVKYRDDIANLISEENGKNIAECWTEILVVLEILKAHRKQGFVSATEFRGSGPLNFFKRIKTDQPPDLKGKEYGVAGLILPWNYPFMIFSAAIRCLYYGNAVILKPSEQIPFIGKMIRHLSEEAWEQSGFKQRCDYCPITVVQGEGSVGKAMVDLFNENEINFLVFCGSSEVGRKIKQAVKDRSRLELLLGGKDPMVLLEDCDVDEAVEAIAGGCFFNTGQSCSSIERVYISSKIADEAIEKLLKKVERLKVGYDSNDPSIDLGPIMNWRQFDLIVGHLTNALLRGAKILFGGEKLSGGIYDRGYYIGPTVLTDVTHDMKIMTEETFGPMAPIMVADDEEELIRLANDSKFGLTASIWTRDLIRGESIARRIEAGTVYVNDMFWTASEPKVHWPGAKESGNFIGEQPRFQDKVIALTKGNVVDRLSRFWLRKNSSVKLRFLKTLVALGYRF